MSGVFGIAVRRGIAKGAMEVLRWAAREAVRPRSGERQYAAAKLLPSQAQYWDGSSTPNSEIASSRSITSSRIRQLVRDMPWMNQAFEAATAYKVGEGFNFSPAVTDADGKMLKRENALIKDAFLEWCEAAEVNGREQFGDIQQLIVRQMLECGEAFIVYRYIGGEFRLQMFEPDCIDDGAGGDNIDQGVEFDRDTNRFVAYWFRMVDDVPGMQEQKRIPAHLVNHMYRTLRPWQRRGISPLVQTSLIAADLDQYLSNELAAQQMASRYLAFVQGGEMADGERRQQETLQNLTIRYLGNDEQVTFAPGGDRPLIGLQGFNVMFLRILSTILKVPYHVVSGEYSSLNYNTLREVRNNTRHLLKPEWAYIQRHFLQPVYARWMDWAVASGRLELKGYYGEPGGRRHWQHAFWMPPGIESVDVLRDIKGVIEGARAGMIDPQDWIMSNGEDPDEILSGIARYIDRLKELGIDKQIGLSAGQDTSIGEAPSDMGAE